MTAIKSTLLQLGSAWEGESNLRVRVRELVGGNNRKVLVDIIEITTGRTSKVRALKLARDYALLHNIVSKDASLINDFGYDRKGTRFDGTKVLTHIRQTTWAFQGT